MQRILDHIKNFGKSASIAVRDITRAIGQKDIFIALVIILVAFASFGLGRLSKIEDSREPITIENLSQGSAAILSQANSTSQASQQVPSEKGKFVASKNGTKYYLPWCSGVSKISETNKVWFQTKEEAETRGLTPAANCPGM